MENERKLITGDIPDFDFGALFKEPEDQGGLMKFVPVLSIFLEVVIIVILIFK